MYRIVFFIPILIFFSCQDAQGEPVPEIITCSTDVAIDESSLVEDDDSFRLLLAYQDSLRVYFENPVNFYALKKQTDHMHSGGAIDLPESYFHKINDPDAIFYAYWAIEFIPPKYKEQHSLDFAVWKPWATAKQKYYETDNETLVGIRCCIEWDGLGRSNFVGRSLDSVEAHFGPSHYRQESAHLYQNNDHLLVLGESSGKITWFKYYWWHEPVYSFDALPEEVFTWKN